MSDTDIVTRLRASTALMASACSVRMDLWQEHSTGALSAANEIERLRATITALRGALAECADELAAEIESRTPAEEYLAPAEYARRMANINRDMAPVLRARALLATERET